MKFREAIKLIITDSGETQRQWARRWGMTDGQLSDYLRGERDVYAETLHKMVSGLPLSEQGKFWVLVIKNGSSNTND